MKWAAPCFHDEWARWNGKHHVYLVLDSWSFNYFMQLLPRCVTNLTDCRIACIKMLLTWYETHVEVDYNRRRTEKCLKITRWIHEANMSNYNYFLLWFLRVICKFLNSATISATITVQPIANIEMSICYNLSRPNIAIWHIPRSDLTEMLLGWPPMTFIWSLYYPGCRHTTWYTTWYTNSTWRPCVAANQHTE